LIAAMTGLRNVVTKCGWRAPTSLLTSIPSAASTVALLIVFRFPMSAPAQKARPLPVTTMARTSVSASASSRRE
jgi:hypothetical protein